MILRALGLATAGVVATLAVATPAWAHGADAPDGTDYRTQLTVVTPTVPGLAVRTVEAGARLELANHTGRTIEVLGYAGEPYLEVRPDGVYQNVHSPATYLNATLDGDAQPPGSADPSLAPSWHRVSREPVVRWHDHRMHWMSAAPPPEVTADPTRVHRIRDWVVPLRDGMSTVDVRGTLDWLPPPNPGVCWAMSLLGAAAIGALGFVAVEGRGGRVAGTVLGGLSATAGAVALACAVARQLDAGATGAGGVLQGLLGGQVWPVLTGLGALGAGAYALARRPAADFALALAGVCLAIFAGAANGAVFARSIPPLALPPSWARIAVAVILATGAGAAVASALRLRAARVQTAASELTPARPADLIGQPSTRRNR